MVHITSSGSIYSFDIFYFVNVLVAGLVLLGFASTIADLFAFWCLGGGQSTVLRNKRCEKARRAVLHRTAPHRTAPPLPACTPPIHVLVTPAARPSHRPQVSKRSEFAETGLKAVIAAHQFKFLDHDRNGVIEAVDLVRALASIEMSDGTGPAISPGQAHAIATAIMADADVDSGGGVNSVGSLDFAEFMTCLDGDGASFPFFLKKLEMQEGRTLTRTHPPTHPTFLLTHSLLLAYSVLT